MDAILKQQLEAALSNKFMGLGDALRNNMLNNPAFADQRREAERLGIPLTTETTTNRTTVDVNFSGAPAGTTVRQTGAAPGVRLNTGPNRGAR